MARQNKRIARWLTGYLESRRRSSSLHSDGVAGRLCANAGATLASPILTERAGLRSRFTRVKL